MDELTRVLRIVATAALTERRCRVQHERAETVDLVESEREHGTRARPREIAALERKIAGLKTIEAALTTALAALAEA